MQEIPGWFGLVLVAGMGVAGGLWWLIKLHFKLCEYATDERRQHEAYTEQVLERLAEEQRTLWNDWGGGIVNLTNFPLTLSPPEETVSHRWRIVFAHEDNGGIGRWEAWNQRIERTPELDVHGNIALQPSPDGVGYTPTTREYWWVFITDRHVIPVQHDGTIAMLQRWQASHDVGPVLADMLEERWPEVPETLLHDLRLPPKQPTPKDSVVFPKAME